IEVKECVYVCVTEGRSTEKNTARSSKGKPLQMLITLTIPHTMPQSPAISQCLTAQRCVCVCVCVCVGWWVGVGVGHGGWCGCVCVWVSLGAWCGIVRVLYVVRSFSSLTISCFCSELVPTAEENSSC